MSTTRMIRLAAAFLVAVLFWFALNAPAGAAVDLGWFETTEGSVHCTITANHLVCERFASNGYRTDEDVVNLWLPDFCSAIRFGPGSYQERRPARIVLSSTTSQGCWPGVAQSRMAGFCAVEASPPGRHCDRFEGVNVFNVERVRQNVDQGSADTGAFRTVYEID